MLGIDQLRQNNKAENYVVTVHGRRRMNERGIKLRDVMHVVECGEIIEQYPDDYPFPSCLILGATNTERFLHAVVSLYDDHIYLITSYYPDETEWEPDMRTRKVGFEMKCMKCGRDTFESRNTEAIELENDCLLVIRNIPCYKCKSSRPC